MKETKFSHLLFFIAIIILIAWAIGIVFKFAVWLLNGLVGLAAIIVAVGLVSMFIKSKTKNKKSDDSK